MQPPIRLQLGTIEISNISFEGNCVNIVNYSRCFFEPLMLIFAIALVESQKSWTVDVTQTYHKKALGNSY